MNGDEFISLDPSVDPLQDVFRLSVTPQSPHEQLVLQLLLDPAADMRAVVRHFGTGLVGSKFIMVHHAIHNLRYILFGSSVHYIFNEKLGLGNSQSDVDLGVVRSADAAMKAVKQWAENSLSFAKHAILGKMRVDAASNKLRGSLGPHVKSCAFITLDGAASFEVQFVELAHFYGRADPRGDFDVCCLRVHNSSNAGELSLMDCQLPPSMSLASVRENILRKQFEIVKPPSGARLGKYLQRSWKIAKRVDFRLDGVLMQSEVATLGYSSQIELLTKACSRNF